MLRFVSLLLLGAAPLGCGMHGLSPTLSIHGLARIKQRARLPEQRRTQDFAITVQLTLANARRATSPAPDPADLASVNARPPRNDVGCEQTALCEWAWLAEEAALVALGIAP